MIDYERFSENYISDKKIILKFIYLLYSKIRGFQRNYKKQILFIA